MDINSNNNSIGSNIQDLTGDNQSNSQQMYNQQQQHHLERQFDPNVNMRASDNISNMNSQINDTPIQTIRSNTLVQSKSLKDKIIDKIKDPIIVVLCAFVLNSPVFHQLLKQYLPTLLGELVSQPIQYIGILLKAIIVGVIFFGVKTVV